MQPYGIYIYKILKQIGVCVKNEIIFVGVGGCTNNEQKQP